MKHFIKMFSQEADTHSLVVPSLHTMGIKVRYETLLRTHGVVTVCVSDVHSFALQIARQLANEIT